MDRSEFERGFREQFGPLCRYARRVAPAEDSRELVQEVFYRSWKSGSAQDLLFVEFRPWLFRALQNLIRDYWRKRQVRRFFRLAFLRGELAEDAPLKEKLVPDLEREVASREWMVRVLDTLSSDHRAVAHLLFVEDLSLIEIAKILGIPQGTVKSRLHELKKKLRTETLQMALEESKSEQKQDRPKGYENIKNEAEREVSGGGAKAAVAPP